MAKHTFFLKKKSWQLIGKVSSDDVNSEKFNVSCTKGRFCFHLFSVFVYLKGAKILHILDKIHICFSYMFCLKQLYDKHFSMKHFF